MSAECHNNSQVSIDSKELDQVLERCLLLVVDGWHVARDGLHSVNRKLARLFYGYPRIQVYCLVLCPIWTVKQEDLEDAMKYNVLLIGTEFITSGNISESFNEDPLAVFPDLRTHVPYVTHIIGHSPISAQGVLRLRDELYTNSKVLLFYHVLPDDVSWLDHAELPYTVPTETDLVRLAEKADVVYSVTHKLFYHFTSKFTNRRLEHIDHRLFLPLGSSEIFDAIQKIKTKPKTETKTDGFQRLVLLTLAYGTPKSWLGLDIAACAVNKVAEVLLQRGVPADCMPRLIIANVPTVNKQAVVTYIEEFITIPNIEVVFSSSMAELKQHLAECTLAIMPARSEPYGHLGMSLISAGVPALIADNCAIASSIISLMPSPGKILVRVTQVGSSVRQDASRWRERILWNMENIEETQKRAAELRLSLKRDEAVKITHDNVVCYCLGGIRLRHHVSNVTFKTVDSINLELPVLADLNKFVSDLILQSWRLKHHKLTDEEDVVNPLAFVQKPHRELIATVVNSIEKFDRRIVGRDKNSGAFYVYCPTRFALCDLWAMCDVINRKLVQVLLHGEQAAPLNDYFGLSDLSLVTTMSGPELLKYKKKLMTSALHRPSCFRATSES